MAKYTITIEKAERDFHGNETDKFVYEQVVENLDVTTIIAVVNGLKKGE